MKETLPRIPIPWRLRWRDARLRLVPPMVFALAVIGIASLWKEHVAPPSLVGQAEPVVSNVSCYKPGVLAELSVNRFQRVKAGDVLGKVMVTDPLILASSLAVIQSEIEVLRVNMKPIAQRQNTAMNYDQLRLDWMRERAQLATTRVNLQLAETEYHRMEELFKEQIVAQRVYEQAKASRDKLQSEVDELSKLVTEGERSLQELQITNTADLSKVSSDPLIAALAVQESKLKLTEAELSPITIKAAMDGIVNTVYHRAGEAITAGQPILSIATLNPLRIVGYLRPPIMNEPTIGMEVEVRTRGFHREMGKARITEVGTQLESIPSPLLASVSLANPVQGLPLDISLPPNLKVRAGELVDIILLSNKR